MNVRTLCLAILNTGETTGYEIRKSASEGKFSHFVDASYGSIYPALERLAKDGKVTFRVEQQDGRPARKVYAITDEGRDELCEALFEPPAPDIYRSEFLMVAVHAETLPREVVARAIQRQLQHLRDEAKLIASIAEEEKGAATTAWAVEYGRHCMASHIEHLERTKDELLALAGMALETQGIAAE